MGWTASYRDKGTRDVDWFPERDEVVHAHGTVNNLFYAAVSKRSDPDRVFARVTLIYRYSRASRGCNIAWKDMHEDVFPFYYQAPVAVLDALTETDSENAIQWRAKCREHHARRAWVRKNVRPGASIRLSRPLHFTDGVERDVFAYAPQARRRNRFVAADGVPVSLKNWRDLEFAVVSNGL